MTPFATLARQRALARAACCALFGAAALATHPASAATTGSGNAASETRAVSGIQAVALRGGIDVVVRQGNSESVQVRADDNVLPLVQTIVDGSGDARTLRVQFKPGESVHTRVPVVVTVDVIKLNAISSSGSGDITVEPLKTPMLALRISGSSDVKLHQLDAEQFSISISGSGNALTSGHAAKLNASIAGSGDLRARDLLADDVSVSIAGSGNASVTAEKSIIVAIAGSGDVDYGGNAVLAKPRIAGTGSVRRRQP